MSSDKSRFRALLGPFIVVPVVLVAFPLMIILTGLAVRYVKDVNKEEWIRDGTWHWYKCAYYNGSLNCVLQEEGRS